MVPLKLSRSDLSAILSFLIPGLGQLYNRTLFRAIFWFILTPGFWIGSGGWLGWICHFAASYTAYRYRMLQEIKEMVSIEFGTIPEREEIPPSSTDLTAP
jgi:TM2 domain-containing membrane protein YozV